MTKLENLEQKVEAKWQEINQSLGWQAIKELPDAEFYKLAGKMEAYKEVLDLIRNTK